VHYVGDSYDFNGKNLTPYGGLLPVITMLEKLGFQSLVEQTVTSKRIPRAMNLYRFVLGIVLGRRRVDKLSVIECESTMRESSHGRQSGRNGFRGSWSD